mgnify:CR=1 FL=1
MKELGSGGGPLTAAVTFAGRTALSRLLHVNLHRFVERVSQAVAQNVGATSHVVARGAVRWVSLFVRNFEMTLYWLVIWAASHLLVVVLGGDLLGHAGVPRSLVLAAEAIPGGMFAISVARLVVAMARVRQVDVFAGGRSPRTLTSGDPPRGWLLLRLLEPTDIDILVVVAVVVILELAGIR